MNRSLSAFALLALLAAFARAQPPAEATWRFAVSGDSRNCGDVVMPAIAAGAARDGAKFYWHLGDLRATYKVDEDIQAESGGALSAEAYHAREWDDFIANQIAPFGTLPFFVGIGNHETIPPKTREEFALKFARWLGVSKDGRPMTYYRWQRGGVDFINLDNATADQFDAAQLAWLEKTLAADRADASVRGVIVGLHRALPNSWSCGHGMNESAEGTESGRRAYMDLLRWTRETGKPVSVLASHSHFVMDRLYDTPYWNAAGRGVLTGWIAGTAGAVRYALPDGLPDGVLARTGVYGYLLGEVGPDGAATYMFRPVSRADVPESVVARFGRKLVDDCFSENKDFAAHKAPAESCSDR